ncbi:MAG: hypothetical protein LBD69_00875 [Puniceicoccales bacterium]|jgi:hypothetical protein|nr:hypothetical protein [Puniceicoccales bacterium]
MSTPDINNLQNYSNGSYNITFDAAGIENDGSYTITKTGSSYTVSLNGNALITGGSLNDVRALFADGTIESISTPKTPVTSPGSRIITDDDIRSLMKLLLQAFTLMINAQRQGDLNDLNGVLNSLATKVEAMEESKEAAYNAAVMQAIGQIVSGSMSIIGGCISAVGAAKGSVETTKQDPGFQAGGNNVNVAAPTITTKTDYGQIGSGIGQGIGGIGGVAQGACGLVAAGYSAEQQEADIKREMANAQLEFWKQGESMDEKSMEAFFNFLKTLLSILQEYRQNNASTEQSIARMS